MTLGAYIPERDLEGFLRAAEADLDTFETATAQLRGTRDAGALREVAEVATRFRRRAEGRGLGQLARLSGFAERLSEAAPKLSAAEFGTLLSFFEHLAVCLRGALGRVAVGDGEGALGLELAQLGGTGLLLSLLKQNPAAFAYPAATYIRAIRTDAASSTPTATTPHALTGLLRTFYLEHREDWTFFAPEIREQVALIRALLAELRTAQTTDPAPRQTLFRALHTVKGTASMVGLAPLGSVAHRLEDLLAGASEADGSVREGVTNGLEAGADVLEGLLAAAEGQRVPLTELVTRLEASLAAATGPVADPAIPAEPALLDSEEIANTAPTFPPLAEGSLQVSLTQMAFWTELTDELAELRARLGGELAQLAELGPLLSAAQRQLHRLGEEIAAPSPATRRASPAAGPGPAPPEVRNASPRLEEIADDLGELGAQLGSLLKRSHGSLSALGRTTRTLRAEVNRSRRVRIGVLFGRFAGFLKGREDVRLETVGEATEVDTQVLDELSEPLLHLVRNALAHAAEPAAVRLAAGKDAVLTLTLRAEMQGRWLRLEVADDGPGVHVAALRRAAVTRGLRSADEVAALSQQEALELMFVPGLSTAPNVDVAAGRGVGMDAVAASVTRLSGTLEVYTEPGQGTRFQLRVPLTRRVSNALFVGAGGQTFALPLGAVRLLTVVPRTALADAQLSAEGEPIPLFELTRLLGLTPGVRPGQLTPDPGDPNPLNSNPLNSNSVDGLPTVVLSAAETRFALVVESLGATAEVVLKGGGELLAGLGYLSGMTVSGTGVATPLLEPGGLLQLAQGGGTGEQLTSADHAPAPLRILLVDDSLSVRRILGRSLAREGFEVVTAADGQEALDLLSGGAFDAVLTDLEMPRLDGFGLIERLRSYPPTAALPICVMTTRAAAAHAEHAMALRANLYLTKPVTAAQLQGFLLPLKPRPA